MKVHLLKYVQLLDFLWCFNFRSKAFETENAIENGAGEIDMVINIGALRGGDDETVKKDIAAVVEAAKGKAIVKYY